MTVRAQLGARPATTPTAWWQRGAVYQIYARSFADSDGDGIGDIEGIRRHLDHVEALHAEAIWLSPIYPSPMADFGYDVSEYCDVDPLFGSLGDLDRLIEDCHARGIRVLLDFVPNHTSEQHPWFLASRSSRRDPQRDWYVWRDGAPGGGPPNDWRSAFPAVGPAWSFDRPSGQWYLHSFAPQQPDLNWDNPEVEAAMHDVLRFWLERGVDGFRLDAIVKIAKDPHLRPNAGAARRRDEDWATIHDRLRRIRRVVDEYPDRVLAGEVYLLDLQRVVAYVDGGDQLDLAHNFVFAELPWSAEAFRASIAEFDGHAAGAVWPAWFLANHDLPRAASRYDHDGYGAVRARAIALMLYALRGTPFIYQGEELGLPDAAIPTGRIVDVDGRDPQRAPIPWRPGPGAGFTTGTPWLPLVAGAERLSVARQAREPRSTLSFVRELAALRARTPALQAGTQRLLDCGPQVLAWIREADGVRCLAAINFTAGNAALELPAPHASLLLSTDPDRAPGVIGGGAIALGPSEGVLLGLDRGQRRDRER